MRTELESKTSPADAKAAVAVESTERNWAVAAHLSAFLMFAGVPSPIGPLVVWLLKRESPGFALEHAKEALNFNVSVFIYAAVLGALIGAAAASIIGIIGLPILVPLLIVVFVVWFIVTLRAALAASRGAMYRYPFSLRFFQ